MVSVRIPRLEDTVIVEGGILPASSATERTAEIFVEQRELKTVDYEPATIQFTEDVTNVAYQFTVNGIAEGVAGYQRVGAKVSLESIRYTIYLHFTDPRDPSASYNPQNLVCRVVLVLDKQPNGTVAFNEVFGGIEADGRVYSGPFCHLIPGNEARFRVLRDMVHTFPTVPGPVGSGSEDCKMNAILSDFVSLKGITTRYSEADELPSSISQGKLIFFLICDGLAAGQAIYMLGTGHTNVRIRFRDAA